MKNKVKIHIGDFYSNKIPTVISTLLGSCVAACLFDPIMRVGGMNHILMPGNGNVKKNTSASARYGINAMELLINDVMKHGGYRHHLVAKIFGGANLLPTIPIANRVGWQNIAFVEEFLQREGIRIISRDVGGTVGRKIYFHSDTGDVFLKRVSSTQVPNIAIEEEARRRRIENEYKRTGEVTLFSGP